ncbi:uncharacterized protein LOC115621957 [Scaptodrosophila lebanonensis]|uniref:Uncharacterized protein LOC115621957 n=1 Tax=Drosophila lebanonensis TaxID=7225 RepID=A0A6J2T6M8_DROLE|nr:uncharacterized protein LOC115621957 [Scaptodrosophila lebanonensis]
MGPCAVLGWTAAAAAAPAPLLVPASSSPPGLHINVVAGMLFELNKCQRRGETHYVALLLPPLLLLLLLSLLLFSLLLLYSICMSCQDDALKTQNINTLTPSFLSGSRKQTTHTHKTPCWIIQLDAISRHNARYAAPSLHSTANGTRAASGRLRRADEVAIQSHKHVERGRKVSAKPRPGTTRCH